MTTAQKRQKVTFAFQQFGAGKLDQAESLCRDLLADDEQQGEAWFVLGWVHRRRKQDAEAIECFGKACAADRSDARFPNALGTALMAAGRFDEAVAACRRAIDLQPAFAEAHANRAPKEMFAGPSELLVHEVFLSTDLGDEGARSS